MFCPKCGKELEDGSAFCAHCGSPTGLSSQPQAAPPPKQEPAGPSAAQIATQGAITFFKDYMKNPVSAAREQVAKRSLTTSVILLVIQAVVSGLVLFSLLSGLCGMVKDLMFASMGFSGLSSLGASLPQIGPSFFVSLMWGILLAAVVIAVFILLLFAVCKLVGSTCTIQDVMIACGAHSIFVTILLLITFLLFFISIQVGIVFLVGALIAWITTGVFSVQALVQDATSSKLWVGYIAAALVTLVVGYFMAGQAFMGSVREVSISYQGESHTIGEAMDLSDGMDYLELLDQLLDEMD